MKQTHVCLALVLSPVLLIAQAQEREPNYRVSPETIKIGKAMLTTIAQVADPRTHNAAVAKLDKTKAIIMGDTSESDADTAVLTDLMSLYMFATYMYDTRDHWMKLDPLIKTHPQNLFLLHPYSDCWQKVRGELETGVAFGADVRGCELSIIGEHL